MKLSIKLLNQDAQLNSWHEMDQLQIQKGDTAQLVFQLWDAEQDQRYIPPASTTALSTTGNTSINSNQLTGMTSIAGLIPGLAVTGPGIPPGTTVVSASGATVVMSQNASASASGASLAFQTYGTTVLVQVSRFAEFFGTVSNQRTVSDFSVTGYAAPLFPADDRSIWYLPMTSPQTQNIATSGVNFVMNTGSVQKSCTVPMLIRAFNQQED